MWMVAESFNCRTNKCSFWDPTEIVTQEFYICTDQKCSFVLT